MEKLTINGERLQVKPIEEGVRNLSTPNLDIEIRT